MTNKSKIIFSSYRHISIDILESNIETKDISTREFFKIDPLTKEKPKDFVLREAESNSRLLFHSHEAKTSLSISTIIACGTRILRSDKEGDIENFLKLLSGRRHKLISAISFHYKANNIIKVKNILSSNIIKIKRLEKSETEFIKNNLNQEPIFYLDNLIGSRYIKFIEGPYGNIDKSYGYEMNSIRQILNNI